MSWSTSKLRVRLARRETGFSPPVKYFTDRSKAVLLLWIFYVLVLSCVCYVFVRVCLYVLCGHLLGKGWPLGSRLWCLTMSLSLSHWCPGSGVVLDCIDSWSLHPYLLWTTCRGTIQGSFLWSLAKLKLLTDGGSQKLILSPWLGWAKKGSDFQSTNGSWFSTWTFMYYLTDFKD